MTEQELEKLCSKENPFRVPEGYFEDFQQQMMEKIAATPKKARMVWLRPLLAAAACVCVAVFALSLIFSQKVEEQASVAQVEEVSDQYMNEAMDYAMIDNGDLYACMMEE
ncbi:MAG: hypothetical protein Q4F34_01710 [Prevotellaceae bacterium]|nr:hypothetical protein [Prevotellaceae bacterium]